MARTLDIIGVSQTPGTDECGIASTKMVGDYFGMRRSYDEIKEKLPIIPGFGIYIYDIGSYFLEAGFKAEIVTQNTRFLKTKHQTASTQEIRDHVESLKPTVETDPYMKGLGEGFQKITDFIDAGGKFTARRPTPHVITQELSRRRPVITAMTTRFLYDLALGHNQHFCVMTGYNHNMLSFIDPASYFKGETQTFAQKDVIYGIHANTYPSVEGGSILKLKR